MLPESVSVAANDSGPSLSGSEASPVCVHCGMDVPAGFRSISESTTQSGPFCCHGCETAWLILQDSDELRDHFQQRAAIDPATRFVQMDHEAFGKRHVKVISRQHHRVRLLIEGITCASCVWAIERLPSFLNGVLQVRVNLATCLVTVDWNPAVCPLSDVASALHRLGYTTHPADDHKRDLLELQENRRRLIHLAIAGACAGNTMLIAIALYLGVFSGMSDRYMNLFRWTSAGIALLSTAWPGAVFFRNAANALRTRTSHMDLPVAVGLFAGMLLGIVNTVLGRGEVYFDSITVLVFLLLVGRYLQYAQQRKAIRQVSLRNALIPHAAFRLLNSPASCTSASDDFETETVPPEAIEESDWLLIRAGDLFPVDGTVVHGQSSVDSSILTGESRAIRISEGQPVAAGTTNLTSPLIIRATETVGSSRIDRIAELVEAGVQSKTPIVQFANSIGGFFVMTVLVLSGLTFLLWLPSGIEPAFNNALSLLIVACPCALGLATPFTIAIAQARAARQGMLIKSGDVFERLNEPADIWLDKTGTVTEGQPQVLDFIGDTNVIPAVIAIERQVIHPLADALVSGLVSFSDPGDFADVTAEQVTVISGAGVCGMVAGQTLTIGSPDHVHFVLGKVPPEFLSWIQTAYRNGHTALLIAINEDVVAACSVGDHVRSDAKQVLDVLAESQKSVRLLSGDHQDVVERVGAAVGLSPDRCEGGVTPEDKLSTVRRSAGNGRVIMVGDGVNDSAALAAADVGIAVHGGAAASLEAADVYLKNPGLSPILDLLRGARSTVRTIWVNFAASLTYNIAATVLAMSGLIHPIIAAVLMPLSSLTVLTIAFLNPAFMRPVDGVES